MNTMIDTDEKRKIIDNELNYILNIKNIIDNSYHREQFQKDLKDIIRAIKLNLISFNDLILKIRNLHTDINSMLMNLSICN
jgi:esterase/lipase